METVDLSEMYAGLRPTFSLSLDWPLKQIEFLAHSDKYGGKWFEHIRDLDICFLAQKKLRQGGILWQ